MIFIYANVASVISIFVLCTLLSITGKKMLGGINEYLETRSNAVICNQRIFSKDIIRDQLQED